MKILHIDETFHPNFGYHCNPLAKFQQMQGHQVIILTVEKKYIYPVYKAFGENGEELEDQDKIYQNTTGVKILRIHASGYIANRLNYKVKELFKTVKNIDPDVVYVHCMETLTAIRILFKYCNRYPLIMDSHMLKMASKHKFSKLFELGYRSFITPLIKRKKIPIILTQNDSYVVDHLGVPIELTHFISFGTDTNIFTPSKDIKMRFKIEKGLSKNAFVIVSTGKLSQGKGGMLLAEAVAKQFQTNREVVVVIVANFNGTYERKVMEKLKSSKNRIIYYPVQSYLNLPYFYQIADICIFPKQCSLSFYDAQACGLPVISENNKVNIDRNSHGNGLCFIQDNQASLREKIEVMINMSNSKYKEMSDASLNFVKDNYNYELIAKQYTSILSQEYNKFHNRL